MHFFTDPNEFLKSNIDLKHAFLFSDYDLQKDKNGLDVIRVTGMEGRSLLVTGMAFDENLKTKAHRSNVRIIDKALLSTIDIIEC